MHDINCKKVLALPPRRLVHRQTLRELEGTAAYQRKLIDVAVQLIKPGGYLVFSTCTFNPGGVGVRLGGWMGGCGEGE